LKELKDTAKEVKHMNEEVTKKDKQVRFQFKLNKKNEKGLKEAVDKIDYLEMDNYMLREQVTELVKYLEEYEAVIREVLSVLDQDSISEGEVVVMKEKLGDLSEKIKFAK
jgi:small-conductance mechanosensitive channel